jgi:hypothetical protein
MASNVELLFADIDLVSRCTIALLVTALSNDEIALVATGALRALEACLLVRTVYRVTPVRPLNTHATCAADQREREHEDEDRTNHARLLR